MGGIKSYHLIPKGILHKEVAILHKEVGILYIDLRSFTRMWDPSQGGESLARRWNPSQGGGSLHKEVAILQKEVAILHKKVAILDRELSKADPGRGVNWVATPPPPLEMEK